MSLAFLVADTQLYKNLCPLVGPSIGPLVCEHEWKSGEYECLDAFSVCVARGGGGIVYNMYAIQFLNVFYRCLGIIQDFSACNQKFQHIVYGCLLLCIQNIM